MSGHGIPPSLIWEKATFVWQESLPAKANEKIIVRKEFHTILLGGHVISQLANKPLIPMYNSLTPNTKYSRDVHMYDYVHNVNLNSPYVLQMPLQNYIFKPIYSQQQ